VGAASNLNFTFTDLRVLKNPKNLKPKNLLLPALVLYSRVLSLFRKRLTEVTPLGSGIDETDYDYE